MYYCGKFIAFLGSNAAIIGKKESGKTTILRNVIDYCYENDYTVLLFDSAADHIEKSILVETSNKYKDNYIITSPRKEDIIFNGISNDSYPFKLVDKTCNKIYSFDVSKYLKEESETDSLEQVNPARSYYKQLVIQELTVMLPIVSKKKCVVIMDEIEFVPLMGDIIKKYNSCNIQFLVSVHNSESIPNSLFDVLLIL
jgi:hypothetical protein